MGQAKIRKKNGTYFGQQGYGRSAPAIVANDVDLGTSAYKESYRRDFDESFRPPVPTAEERRETSFHEAGHAVIHQGGGLEVDFVTSLPYFEADRGWARGITVLKEKKVSTPETMRAYLVGIVAGDASTIKAGFDVVGLDDGDEDQLRRVFEHQLGFVFVKDGWQKLLNRIREEAAKEMEKPGVWESIEETARLLQIQDRISGSEVHSILEKNAAAQARRGPATVGVPVQGERMQRQHSATVTQAPLANLGFALRMDR